MKKFTLYIPLLAGILSILLAVLIVIYTFTMTEPSGETICKMIAVWLLLIALSIHLISEFISDIQSIAYWEGNAKGYDDCKDELKNGPLKDMYQQWLNSLNKQ